MDTYDKCQNIISELDSFMVPVMEEYSDISIFFKDGDFFLEGYHKNNPGEIYTEPLGIEGIVYSSIIKAGKELTNVNAYTEALRIYQTFIDKLEMIAEGLNTQDKRNIETSIDTIQGLVLDTMKARDSYQARRRSTISKYSGIIKD